jgi:hydrogenase maturation protein HypF
LLLLDHRPVISELLDMTQAQQKQLKVALGFHGALARAAAQVCARVRRNTGVAQVALSGGVFQNALLLGELSQLLLAEGFTVYTNNAVPCNDGGLALGQAYVAALKMKEGK